MAELLMAREPWFVFRIPRSADVTPRPHLLDNCWCGHSHHEQVSERGDDLRVRPSDSRAESQAGSNGPSGSLNPLSERATHTCSGCDATLNIEDWPTAVYHEGCPNDGVWVADEAFTENSQASPE